MPCPETRPSTLVCRPDRPLAKPRFISLVLSITPGQSRRIRHALCYWISSNSSPPTSRRLISDVSAHLGRGRARPGGY